MEKRETSKPPAGVGCYSRFFSEDGSVLSHGIQGGVAGILIQIASESPRYGQMYLEDHPNVAEYIRVIQHMHAVDLGCGPLGKPSMFQSGTNQSPPWICSILHNFTNKVIC